MAFIDLSCPRCGLRLSAPANIRVYVCEACATTSTPSFAGPKSGEGPCLWIPPRRLLRPRRDLPSEGPIRLLPLWVIPLRVEGGPEALPEELRVPAVGRRAFGRLVESARRLSRSRVSWDELSEREAPPIPRPPQAELGIEEAYAIAEIVTLGLVEGWPTEEELPTWEPTFGPIRLVDLPCHEIAGELVELAQGLAVDPGVARALEPLDARGRFHEQPLATPL